MSQLEPLPPCTVPTMYFIGVTTTQSSIMKVFPKWSDILGLGAQIRGYDAPIHAPAETYRRIVTHIQNDPLALGALVTTHKIDLLDATRDLFDWLDAYALICGEISSISKRDGQLQGHAKDPISAGLAWETFVPNGYFAQTSADVLCLGAGGAALAIALYLAGRLDPADRPPRLIAVDRSQARLHALEAAMSRLQTGIAFEYVLNDDPQRNDALLEKLPPASVVINATGMGKDIPGSPITDQARFPEHGRVWELNYRGALDFLRQAQRQAASRDLTVEDGWVYFLHGWTQVIAQVFHIGLTPELMDRLAAAAASLRT